jgi:hypothetical protein
MYIENTKKKTKNPFSHSPYKSHLSVVSSMPNAPASHEMFDCVQQTPKTVPFLVYVQIPTFVPYLNYTALRQETQNSHLQVFAHLYLWAFESSSRVCDVSERYTHTMRRGREGARISKLNKSIYVDTHTHTH